jgi:WD40 repeat protein
MEKIKDISHQGRDIFLVNGKGELINISFERDEVLNFTKPDSPALVLAPFPGYKIITGHEDGTIRIWDFLNKNVQVLEGHQHPVKVLRVDYFGRIFSGSSDNVLRQWDVNRQTVKTIDILDNNISLVRLHNNGKLLVLTGENIPIIGGAERSTHKIRILDFEKGISELINLPFKQRISNINSYFDGRIIAGLLNSKMRTEPGSGTLAVISLKKNSWEYSLLAGHEIDTKDCLAVGPKIITCGRDGKGEHTIRLWGTESYVKSALSKLSIVPSRL